MNILKADMYHLTKDKLFYVLLALTFFLPLLTCLMFPNMTVEKVIYQGLDTTILCSIVGIMIATFVGKDYTNNTIRNKICCGENRYKIMTVTFVESIIICLTFIVVSTVSSFIFGSIIGEFIFSTDFFVKFICQIAILLAFSMLTAAITTCSKSMRTGLVITLMISVILSAIAQMLPMLAVSNKVAALLSRIVYATVSSNMLNSTDGSYIYTTFTQDGMASITFNHLYLNALLMAFVYAIAAVSATALTVRKQSYK